MKKETRAVYFGGFGNGWNMAEKVEAELGERHLDAAGFTFTRSRELQDRGQLAKLVKGATVYEHSAGATIDLHGMSPAEIVTIDGPLPTSRRHLVAATLKKTVRMHLPVLDIKSAGKMRPVWEYDASAIGELIAHPVANLSQLGRIAGFDTLDMLADASAAGIATTAVFMEDSDYFKPKFDDGIRAALGGTAFYMLEGQHDELPLHPSATLDALDRAIAFSNTITE